MENRQRFSWFEREVLMKCVNKYKNILDNKTTNAFTNREKKKAWDFIDVEFNEVQGVRKRSSKQLLICYKNMKSRAALNKKQSSESSKFSSEDDYNNEEHLMTIATPIVIYDERQSDPNDSDDPLNFKQNDSSTDEKYILGDIEESNNDDESELDQDLSEPDCNESESLHKTKKDNEEQQQQSTVSIEITNAEEVNKDTDVMRRNKKRLIPNTNTAETAEREHAAAKKLAIEKELEQTLAHKEQEHKIKMKILEIQLQNQYKISELLKNVTPDKITLNIGSNGTISLG